MTMSTTAAATSSRESHTCREQLPEDKIVYEKIVALCQKINTVLFHTEDVVNSLKILANDVNKCIDKSLFGRDDSSPSPEDKASLFVTKVREKLLPEVKSAFDGMSGLVSCLIEIVGCLCSMKIRGDKDTQEEKIQFLREEELRKQIELLNQKNRGNTVVKPPPPAPDFEFKVKQNPFNATTDAFLCLSSWVVEGDVVELKNFGTRLGLDIEASVERAHKIRAKLEERMRKFSDTMQRKRAGNPSQNATLSSDLPEQSPTTAVPAAMWLGVIPNIYLLYSLLHLPSNTINTCVRIFIGVNTFRCVFPNRYNNNIVLRDTIFSSIFLTRLLATFSEMSWLIILSEVARDLNSTTVESPTIDLLADILPPICALAQCFVWSSIILHTDSLMFYEEFSWFLLFVINTGINTIFFLHGNHSILVSLSLLHGALYLPWQTLHLKYILSLDDPALSLSHVTCSRIQAGLRRALWYRKRSVARVDWGGWIGESWMFCYWVVMPVWLAAIAWEYDTTLEL
ncbi:hypothetical protein ACHWQZ_G018974 [Mnemiopsis leidyi]